MKNKEIIVVADDFGISKGVNQAIIQAHNEGLLTHASLMVSSRYAEQAVQLAKENTNLKIGLHVDLISGQYSSKKTSFLTKGFFDLVLKSLTLNKFYFIRQIYREIDAQIIKGRNLGIQFSHIDSHMHTHMIPLIFCITKRLAKKYKIQRIRVVNESFIHTICSKPNFWSMIKDLGIIKYFILKFFYLLNKEDSEYYFCSILNSCCISSKFVTNLKMPKKYKKLEIMLHPGHPAFDRSCSLPINEKDHLLDLNRLLEFNTSIDLKVYLNEGK